MATDFYIGSAQFYFLFTIIRQNYNHLLVQVLLTDHSKELEQAKNHILEKEEVVLKLQEHLSKCQADLAEHENKLNDLLQVEVHYNFNYSKL